MDKIAKESRAAEEHEKALAEYFLRTEPLGHDRYRNAYWCFEGDTKVFVQLHAESHCWQEWEVEVSNNAKKEYDTLTGKPPGSSSPLWRIYSSMWEIWQLVESLDERGVREKALKSKLKARFRFSETSGGYDRTGSDYIGRKVQRKFGKVIELG